MAQRSGLFDSTEIVSTEGGYPKGNRAETADFFARYFSNFIGNGVFAKPATCFEVQPQSGLDVVVKAGACFINGYFAFDDEDETVTLEAGHSYYLVQRAHIIAGGDIQKVWVRDGSLDELPRRDGTYYDLLLAVVTVPSGASGISYSMITDYRYDSNYCGLVHATIDQLDTSEVARQLRTATEEFIAAAETQLENNETEFDTWFETIIGKLGTDPAGQLELNKADKVTGATEGNFAALDASGNLTDSGKKIADFVAANPLIAQYVNGVLQTLGGTRVNFPNVESGTYQGNGSASRTLTFSFAPKVVLLFANTKWVYSSSAVSLIDWINSFVICGNNLFYATGSERRDYSSRITVYSYYEGTATLSGERLTLTATSTYWFNGDGFTYSTSTEVLSKQIANASGATYSYVAIG